MKQSKHTILQTRAYLKYLVLKKDIEIGLLDHTLSEFLNTNNRQGVYDLMDILVNHILELRSELTLYKDVSEYLEEETGSNNE